ncbi:MAG: MBL fold hydrolase [Candidatus Raymondbacteria bacterium RifOxyA12_full_50_37]|uniref:MBL fold hydrolase n=1 Tax=Candidatus Raymondbacteria bacterium RIFOXYD12_FULL_49_13 TaxID=1817890 RepID=A0A1F7F9Y7_UNCRA|nr:MAG: MBL fold hydrolase [Candidatus Raymondbacteria bacterium RifOxyA12_full_50_37]OGJ87772.1 MAG: MBL fold hydrolase [Candidatus Raymondbacteria bacterium RIFOXYA2_FULL_49_16]OGJ95449.1 MAG: MBL fold hydrolase [Candidatus Raymondbacteria bacterium RifOxyC12_full_50_8]OGJ95650.1 MAG: MBL fold hydrolase [Candidatus Raymondbacteria bacterium RIFOXYC2_FULL_50_21]OGK02030.1 MAG: MBL fold hydrolase [Candidatus Raymondbacteria bacterium RifOxyB12_full_50_8]OGK03421.1 MAG: MBL fold hydrolase [Cand
MKITNNVSWVGKIDWELRKFHGNEYSTHKGSTYNSYLIKEEKNVIIDTVWKPFAKEYVEKLKKEIDLQKIDYVVANHAEIDHSGALPELMHHIPDVPIYCTKNAVTSLKGHYHKDWNFVPVKTGDTIDVGNGKSLVFVEMTMLHWPDSMASYLTGDNILFSNDAFGQHYASEYMFNDLVDQNELFHECIKYYANILTPFSPFVTKKIHEVLEMKIPINIIATSHGVIWRDNPVQIVEKYLAWANKYQENQITILYDTMWDGTRIMAENIAVGIKKADDKVNIKLFNVSKTDKNDIISEIFKSKTVLLGSPTINKGISVAIAGLLEEIEGLQFKNKKAVAFGSYGWSGESIIKITNALEKSGFAMINKGFKCLWNPDDDSIQQCISLGVEVAKSQ